MQMETPSLFLGLSNFLSYSATTLLQAYSSSSRYYSFHQIFLTSLSIAPRCISKIINKKQKTLICGQYALALADCFSSDHGLLTDLYLTLRLPELHCPVMSNCQLCRIQPLHCSLASSSAWNSSLFSFSLSCITYVFCFSTGVPWKFKFSQEAWPYLYRPRSSLMESYTHVHQTSTLPARRVILLWSLGLDFSPSQKLIRKANYWTLTQIH